MSEKEISCTEDIITPERAAKGDLKISYNRYGKISDATPIDKFVIRELIRIGVMDKLHEIYGLGFLELRAAFRSPWNVKSGAVMLAQWGKGISTSQAGAIYQNVCRGIKGRGIEVIEYAMECDYTLLEGGRSKCVALYDNGLYKEHFEKLIELMDSERERAFEESKINGV